MNCLDCRSADLEERLADMPAEIKGEFVLASGVKALVCPNCGYRTLPASSMSEYMRLAADSYRRKNGLLTSDEIRERRESTRMTQDEFARYLGVGPASIKRWELGQVQDVAMDKLIRTHTDASEAYRLYECVSKLLSKPTLFWLPKNDVQYEERVHVSWASNDCRPMRSAGRQ